MSNPFEDPKPIKGKQFYVSNDLGTTWRQIAVSPRSPLFKISHKFGPGQLIDAGPTQQYKYELVEEQ